ncbi:MAG: hypothetical protein JWO38_3346 [Gemmataceae bacterium]|nr:hypothetical protein [Gemmataceae bacterium]
MTQIRLAPATRPVPGRETVLRAVLDPDRLPVLPAVALRVVQAASQPDCRVGEIVSLLGQDPGLCAKLLKAVNSAAAGRARPVSSIDRAVVVVGLNKLRSLALALSLPAMRPRARPDPTVREHSLSSVGGAIIAREMAVRLHHPAPEDDLVAGLLRDIGTILLRQTFPDAWSALVARPGDPLEEGQCARERDAFGIDHAEVGAEVLKSWNLPEDVVEPIRHHHTPGRLTGADPRHAARAELLWFAGLLTRIHTLVEYPCELDRILAVAEERFGLPRADLADFLQGVWPKIDEYALLLNQDVGRRPNYRTLLSAGTQELARLRDEPEPKG